MSLSKEIIEVVAKTLEVPNDQVKEDKKLYDSLGVDSTEMVELTVALSRHFTITIGTDEITKFSTPADIVEVVTRKKDS